MKLMPYFIFLTLFAFNTGELSAAMRAHVKQAHRRLPRKKASKPKTFEQRLIAETKADADLPAVPDFMDPDYAIPEGDSIGIVANGLNPHNDFREDLFFSRASLMTRHTPGKVKMIVVGIPDPDQFRYLLRLYSGGDETRVRQYMKHIHFVLPPEYAKTLKASKGREYHVGRWRRHQTKAELATIAGQINAIKERTGVTQLYQYAFDNHKENVDLARLIGAQVMNPSMKATKLATKAGGQVVAKLARVPAPRSTPLVKTVDSLAAEIYETVRKTDGPMMRKDWILKINDSAGGYGLHRLHLKGTPLTGKRGRVIKAIQRTIDGDLAPTGLTTAKTRRKISEGHKMIGEEYHDDIWFKLSGIGGIIKDRDDVAFYGIQHQITQGFEAKGRALPLPTRTEEEAKYVLAQAEEQTEKLGRQLSRMGYRGQFSLNLYVDSKGRVMLGEINGRPGDSDPAIITRNFLRAGDSHLYGTYTVMDREVPKSYILREIQKHGIHYDHATHHGIILEEMMDWNLHFKPKHAYQRSPRFEINYTILGENSEHINEIRRRFLDEFLPQTAEKWRALPEEEKARFLKRKRK